MINNTVQNPYNMTLPSDLDRVSDIVGLDVNNYVFGPMGDSFSQNTNQVQNNSPEVDGTIEKSFENNAENKANKENKKHKFNPNKVFGTIGLILIASCPLLLIRGLSKNQNTTGPIKNMINNILSKIKKP